jgi:hypothetical protein
MRSAALEISESEFLRLSDVEQFNDGSGCCCWISVGAGTFACLGRRFYFDELAAFVEQLRTMYKALEGHAELRHRYEADFVRFEVDARGHVHVSGQLTGNVPDGCSLRWSLDADQTFLPAFISDLDGIVRGLHA